MRRGNDRNRQCGRQVKDDRQWAANLPCQTNTRDLMPFGPEQVEEEGRAENESDKDAGEDVVRRRADVVVVVLVDGVVRDMCNPLLLVDIICGWCRGQQSAVIRVE